MTARSPSRRQAFATILALVFLALLTILSVAFATSMNNNSLMSANHVSIQVAQLQAESGLAFMENVLSGITLPAKATGQTLLDAIASKVGARLNGTANLNGHSVSYNGTTITIPAITTDSQGRNFVVTLSMTGPVTLTCHVTGQDGGVSRTVEMDFSAIAGSTTVFNYAVATKSAISMGGQSCIMGVNSPNEASVLTTSYSNPQPITMSGQCSIQGDVFISNPAASVNVSGNVTIGGQTINGDIDDHIHVGVGNVDFPEVDPSVFVGFATNFIDGSTKIANNAVLKNVRIRANSNITFSSSVTLEGVIYIEQPNKISFGGKVDVIGVIVTQDAGDNAYAANTLKFAGQTSVKGVEYLPNTPEFAGIRNLGGSFLLAPGFGVEFSGQFGTINGTIAADQFKFSGQATGNIEGTVINYSDSEFTLAGQSNLAFDRAGETTVPSGFALPTKLAAVHGSYRE